MYGSNEIKNTKESKYELLAVLATVRVWLIRWLYAFAIGHFVIGILLAWCAHLSWFDNYHWFVLSNFFQENSPYSAQLLELWWVNLFGATLQNLAIFMGVLIYMGDRYRSTFVWGWTIIGLLVWAPQDMLISLHVNIWLHVLVDAIVLILMLPPLMMLWWLDRNIKCQ